MGEIKGHRFRRSGTGTDHLFGSSLLPGTWNEPFSIYLDCGIFNGLGPLTGCTLVKCLHYKSRNELCFLLRILCCSTEYLRNTSNHSRWFGYHLRRAIGGRRIESLLATKVIISNHLATRLPGPFSFGLRFKCVTVTLPGVPTMTGAPSREAKRRFTLAVTDHYSTSSCRMNRINQHLHSRGYSILVIRIINHTNMLPRSTQRQLWSTTNILIYLSLQPGKKGHRHHHPAVPRSVSLLALQ